MNKTRTVSRYYVFIEDLEGNIVYSFAIDNGEYDETDRIIHNELIYGEHKTKYTRETTVEMDVAVSEWEKSHYQRKSIRHLIRYLQNGGSRNEKKE